MLPSITAQPKKPLSKEQQNFNKLSKKIEKLQRLMKEERERMERMLDYYSAEIYPLMQQMLSHHIEIVPLLYTYIEMDKAMTKSESKTLRQILSGLLNKIFSASEHQPNEKMKEIFRDINGVSYEEALQDSFAAIREEMEAMYRNMGYNVDLGDINPGDDPNEIARKMAQKQEKINQQKEAKETIAASRKKTVKQLKKEEEEKQKEELKKKDLSTIYRQLVKVIHPDLEQDDTLRKEKETIMAQLTTAYQNNDLSTLLRLEMQWLQKDSNHLADLADDKLSLYNQILKEQVYELERGLNAIWQEPRFEPLDNFFHPVLGLDTRILLTEKQNLAHKAMNLAYSVNRLKTNEALAEVKEIIKTYKSALKSQSEKYQYGE